MEETVRTLLQYKSKFEQLKQDRHSVANSYEVSQSFLPLYVHHAHHKIYVIYCVVSSSELQSILSVIFYPNNYL